jgi:acyl-CoA thioester hydrolase
MNTRNAECTPVYNFNTEIRVRLPETDAMGVVFHGNYFTYLEVGRVDYLTNLGLCEGNQPISEFQNVVVSAHLDFKSPARLNEKLIIDIRTHKIKKASFTFEFRIRHKSENRLVATGHTTHCAIDDQYRPIPVSDHFRKVISSFEGWNDS